MFLNAATIGLVMSFAKPQRANKLVTRTNGIRIDLGTGDVEAGFEFITGFLVSPRHLPKTPKNSQLIIAMTRP